MFHTIYITYQNNHVGLQSTGTFFLFKFVLAHGVLIKGKKNKIIRKVPDEQEDHDPPKWDQLGILGLQAYYCESPILLMSAYTAGPLLPFDFSLRKGL